MTGTRPFCPLSLETCAHHHEYECHRRWSRPLPENVGKPGCPGFLRDGTKCRIIHVATAISGRKNMFYAEAVQELSMAGRLSEVEC
jgi:hypothetical protein